MRTIQQIAKELEITRKGCKNCNLTKYEEYCNDCYKKLVKLHKEAVKLNSKEKDKIKFYENEILITEPNMNSGEANAISDNMDTNDRWIRAKSFLAGYNYAKTKLNEGSQNSEEKK